MKHGFQLVLILACCFTTALTLQAQAPASSQTPPKSDAPNPSADKQKPAGSSSESNPFPEDTTAVPVVPSSTSPAIPSPSTNDSDINSARFPAQDADPIRSPDDPAPDAANSPDGGSSSSLQGVDELRIPPDAEKPGKHAKDDKPEPTHQEGAAEDVNVGGYYLERKNWRAALSRFESALVLDPENPEVYWGLAEAQRNLGAYSNARVNYQKLLDLDPDGRHGKDARKALKEPQIANAPKAVPIEPSAALPQQ
jgi:hypothetical protein